MFFWYWLTLIFLLGLRQLVNNEIAIRDFDYLSRFCKSLRICDCVTFINYSHVVCNGILYMAGPFVKKFSWGYSLKIFGNKSTEEFLYYRVFYWVIGSIARVSNFGFTFRSGFESRFRLQTLIVTLLSFDTSLLVPQFTVKVNGLWYTVNLNKVITTSKVHIITDIS